MKPNLKPYPGKSRWKWSASSPGIFALGKTRKEAFERWQRIVNGSLKLREI